MLGTTWGEALYNPVCMIAAGVCWELHGVRLHEYAWMLVYAGNYMG